jgi:hypothetical protein
VQIAASTLPVLLNNLPCFGFVSTHFRVIIPSQPVRTNGRVTPLICHFVTNLQSTVSHSANTHDESVGLWFCRSCKQTSHVLTDAAHGRYGRLIQTGGRLDRAFRALGDEPAGYGPFVAAELQHCTLQV